MEKKKENSVQDLKDDAIKAAMRVVIKAYGKFAEPENWRDIVRAQREWQEYWEADAVRDEGNSQNKKEKFSEVFRRVFSSVMRLWEQRSEGEKSASGERARWYKYMYEIARITEDDPETEDYVKGYFRELYERKGAGEQTEADRYRIFKQKYDRFRGYFEINSGTKQWPEYLK